MKQGWIEERTGKRGLSYRVRYWAPNADGDLEPKSASFPVWRYGGKAKAEDAARTHLAKMLTEVRSGGYIAPTTMTVKELVDRWLSEHEHRISGSTAYNYRSALRHLRPEVAGLAIQSLKPMHVQTLYARLRVDGVGAGIMRQLHIVLNAALGQAVEWEILTRNPVAAVKKPELPAPEIRYWLPEQSAEFIRQEGGHVIYGFAWQLVIYTGIRCGELQALRWTDIDFTRKTITITRTVTRTVKGKTFINNTTKTRNSRRTIPLPEPCIEPLKQHRIRQRERQLAAAVWSTSDGDLILTRDDGRFVTHEAIGQAFQRAVARVGLPELSMHGLRHSFATAMLLAGVHPKVVADLLGDTVAMVLRVYSHVTVEARQDAIASHATRILDLMRDISVTADATT